MGVERCCGALFSSRTRRAPAEPWVAPWVAVLPSRLAKARSWLFLDLKRKAMIGYRPMDGVAVGAAGPSDATRYNAVCVFGLIGRRCVGGSSKRMGGGMGRDNQSARGAQQFLVAAGRGAGGKSELRVWRWLGEHPRCQPRDGGRSRSRCWTWPAAFGGVFRGRGLRDGWMQVDEPLYRDAVAGVRYLPGQVVTHRPSTADLSLTTVGCYSGTGWWARYGAMAGNLHNQRVPVPTCCHWAPVYVHCTLAPQAQ